MKDFRNTKLRRKKLLSSRMVLLKIRTFFSLSHTDCRARSLTPSLSFTHPLTHLLSLSLTYSHSLTISHSLLHTLSHTRLIARGPPSTLPATPLRVMATGAIAVPAHGRPRVADCSCTHVGNHLSLSLSLSPQPLSGLGSRASTELLSGWDGRHVDGLPSPPHSIPPVPYFSIPSFLK